MGVAEVLPKLRQFFGVADIASEIFARHRPDAVVLADFPGFNWHIARRAKRHGIPVIYYLPPQLWAWAPWRIRKVRKYVDHVLSVLPFEHQWYRQRGIDSTFVGHPFFDAVAEQRLDPQLMQRLQRTAARDGRRLVAILPGSRSQEVHRNWPSMLVAVRQLAQQFPDVRFAVAAFRDAHCLWCRDQLQPSDHQLPLDFYVGKTSEIVEAAHCAMMVSGSVSLELLARRTPAAVIYQTSRLMYATGRALVRVPSMTLPNLIAGETVFPELATPLNLDRGAAFLRGSVAALLSDPVLYQRRCEQLDRLRQGAMTAGASQSAAEAIRAILRTTSSPGRLEADRRAA
jgi:lipid-A-disaccharide synthase